jgi:pyrimidine-nucleoside phosphorylase
LEDTKILPQAKFLDQVIYEGPPSFLARIDALSVGEAARVLGAGRANAESQIDPAVGIVLGKKLGDPLDSGDCLFQIFYNDEQLCAEAKKRLKDAVGFSGDEPVLQPLIMETITAQ